SGCATRPARSKAPRFGPVGLLAAAGGPFLPRSPGHCVARRAMFESLLNHASNGFVHTTLIAKLVILLVTTQLTILSVTLYLHRSQSHRSVEFHPALAHAFRFWCWLTTAMVTREWVAIHRKHHA